MTRAQTTRAKSTRANDSYAANEARWHRGGKDWLLERPKKNHRYLNASDTPIFDDRYVYGSQRKIGGHPKLAAAEKRGTWNHDMYRFYKNMPPGMFISRAGVAYCCRKCRARQRASGSDDVRFYGCAAEVDAAQEAVPEEAVPVPAVPKGGPRRKAKASKRARAVAARKTESPGGSAANGVADIPAPQEDSFLARPSIKLHVPDQLKALLVDDWENVTKNNQLVPVPHPQPVTKILNEYLESERPKRTPGSASADVLEETTSGLREYFDRCLGRILLYR